MTATSINNESSLHNVILLAATCNRSKCVAVWAQWFRCALLQGIDMYTLLRVQLLCLLRKQTARYIIFNATWIQQVCQAQYMVQYVCDNILLARNVQCHATKRREANMGWSDL